jgi:DNA adenine methylase
MYTPATERTDIQGEQAYRHILGLEKSPYVRPVMIYRGNKYRLLDWILPKLPKMPRYIEPFGGTAAVLLNRAPADFEIYNDFEPHWGDLIRLIQNDVELITEYIDWCPYARAEYESAQRGSAYGKVARAAAWYLRHTVSYGARGNWFQQGAEAAPKVQSYRRDYEIWPTLQKRLQGIGVFSVSYDQLFRDHDTEDTLWYCDPPYLGTQGFYQKDFGPSDHHQFLNKVQQLKGHVVVSHFAHPLYEDQPWDERYYLDRPACLSGKTEDVCVEALYVKYPEVY